MQRIPCLLLFAFALALLPSTALAQTTEVVPNVFAAPDDGAGNFGRSIAMDGDIMVVGAPLQSGGGSVYVLGRNVGGTNTWGLVKKLSGPSIPTNHLEFGWSVALQGDTLVVGAPRSGANQAQRGYVYIFERNEGGPDNWGEIKAFTTPQFDTYTRFGTSVAIDGDTLVVGAPKHGDGGAAFIYERDQGGPNAWGFAASRTGARDADFGQAVAIEGDMILISAPTQNVANVQGIGRPTGRVHALHRDSAVRTLWNGGASWTASDYAEGMNFGIRISLEGNRLAVGAHTMGAGAAYLFEYDAAEGTWSELQKFRPFDWATALPAHFGLGIHLAGERLLVGASSDDSFGDNAGSVYVYEENEGGPGNWGIVAKWRAFDSAPLNRFGFSFATNDDTTVIGARTRDNDPLL